ncbi:unnamed protein product [Adineta steineri]|uniref:Uncharacterized protein n=1 Tax=Adineta steineri TaxID=433720 RepID=A0A815R1H3_9BILA|nr:unnamed protein product [Adineta steineri]CAF4074381.1 unnamed protein product [Adineta steineri]
MAQQNENPTIDLTHSIRALKQEIDIASDKVQRDHDEALEKVNEWRQNQIEIIEQLYMGQCHDVEEHLSRLKSLDQDVRHRLATEIDQPLADLNVTNETMINLQQKVDSIFRDVSQLRWNVLTKDRKIAIAKIPVSQPEKHSGFSSVFEQAAVDHDQQETTWVGGWAEEAKKYRIIPRSVQDRTNSKGMVD